MSLSFIYTYLNPPLIRALMAGQTTTSLSVSKTQSRKKECVDHNTVHFLELNKELWSIILQ